MRVIKTMFKTVWYSINDLVDHDGVEHAGYLAFLLMLTIFPFLVFIMALLGFFGSQDLANLLIDIILDSSWASFIGALKPRIVEITSTPPQGFLTLAILSAVWTASSIFEGVRTILNKAYRVKQPPGYLLRRMVSIVEFLVAISFMICLMVVLVILPYISEYMIMFLNLKGGTISHFLDPSTEELRFTILIAFACVLLAMVYSRMPSRPVRFVKSLPGALVVMIGWWIASISFKYYLTNFPQVNVIYGSIAGVIIALLYFYICSIIFIFGAELNYRLELLFNWEKK